MFNSTRDNQKLKTASQAIIEGIASDGGLFVCDKIPTIDLESLNGLNYHQLAIAILKLFLDDFSEKQIEDAVYKAYDNKFSTKNVVDLHHLSDCSVLELYHGPTLSFKDVALSLLPILLDESKKITNQNDQTIILTATSGDTGSAALAGFSQSPNVAMVVFYPTEGVSEIQEKQMQSYASKKQTIIALKGNFDDAQTLVKKAFNDEANSNLNLSSANSINIGRLIPQIVYYFYSYLTLVKENKITMNQEINFCVPTGNFGNILAGYMAKKMGLPINKLICASNENHVLSDFFKTYQYSKNRPFIKTVSPSMDILISSNLERLIYYATSDASLVNQLMIQLNKEGKYQIPDAYHDFFKTFYGNFATEVETFKAIKNLFEKEHYLIDTHTAVAYSVYQKYKSEVNDDTPTVIVSTANPYKFPHALYHALTNNTTNQDNNLDNEQDSFSLIEEIYKMTNFPVPEGLKTLQQDFIKTIWTKEDAYCSLMSLLHKESNR